MAGAAILPTVADIAAEDGLRECLHWFAKEKKWINKRHLELCRIPAPTFQEQRRAEWIAEQLRAAGWPAKVDRAGNVVADLGTGESPRVALTAHLDTVLTPRHADEVRASADGRFIGPGVADNGAGLAALLAVAQAISACGAAERFPGLVLAANVGEEGEGNLSGMRYLCRPAAIGSKVKAFVVLDGPGTDHITARALGSRRFELAITGPGGHSWSDYGAGNPAHALSRAITLFSEHIAVANGSTPRCSFNFGTLEAGPSVNSIPASARSKVDLRSESMARIDEMAALLNGSLERAVEVENDRATGGKVGGKLREIGFRPGGRLADSARILACLRAVDSYLGVRAQADCGSTDANIPLSLGMEAVSIGAGGTGGGAHSPAEWFHPEGRELGLKRILLTLALLVRGGE
jgi:tripeptide aminopeptidase